MWVKEGKVFVKDPAEGGKFPTITPCPGLDLFINGNKVEGKTIVSEKDIIEIITITNEEPGIYKINVVPGGLLATLELKTGTSLRQYIRNSNPENNMVLNFENQVEKTCPCSLDEIMQEMARKNITYGIKHDVIRNVLAKPADGLYIIAEGEAPGNTVDERIELVFQKGPEERRVRNDDKKVNFRDMVEIMSVEPGTLLAVKHMGIQGDMGRKVTGDIIPPVKPQIYELTAGKGVEISSCGNKAIAKIGGSPIVKKQGNRYYIDVNPVLQKKGDVDISSGNIRFKGDVVVHGDVCEGMSVQAAGKINIHGMIFSANIAAQGGISVRQNITGSNMIAGGDSTFYKNIFKILDAIYSDLSDITKMVPGLAQHPKMKGIKTGQLIQVLIDKKFPRIPNLMKELIKYADKHSFILPREIAQLLEKVEKNLRGLNLLKLESLEDLHILLLEIKEAQKTMESMARNKADISFGYAVNSKIEATGNVKVDGRGCINTTIRAGGNVHIKGVFRGGEVTARGDIILNEAGTELGAKTFIRTDEGRKVFITKAHEGVRIQVGDRQVNITSTQNNIKAELDDNGAMKINA
ncbi:MAG: hypothetical protein A4E55_00856 [Pelotomaculum sp. PtaU1.Bin035]|nr:MAG: hypothetical protein A4E55_00856 [Pelotomaculum sp. PtaU1.Bin035]